MRVYLIALLLALVGLPIFSKEPNAYQSNPVLDKDGKTVGRVVESSNSTASTGSYDNGGKAITIRAPALPQPAKSFGGSNFSSGPSTFTTPPAINYSNGRPSYGGKR